MINQKSKGVLYLEDLKEGLQFLFNYVPTDIAVSKHVYERLSQKYGSGITRSDIEKELSNISETMSKDKISASLNKFSSLLAYFLIIYRLTLKPSHQNCSLHSLAS